MNLRTRGEGVKKSKIFSDFLNGKICRSLIARPDGNSQVRQCFGFCTADSWSSSAYESAEQKTQTLLKMRLPISSANRHARCCRSRNAGEMAGIKGHFARRPSHSFVLTVEGGGISRVGKYDQLGVRPSTICNCQ